MTSITRYIQPIRLFRFLTPAILFATIPSGPARATPPKSDEPASSSRIAILFGKQKSYRASASALKKLLEETGARCVGVELPGKKDTKGRDRILETLGAPDIRLIAAAGKDAVSFALEKITKTPVLFFQVPNVPDTPFMRTDRPPPRLAGITIDVRPEAQLEWIRKLCPRARTIALLHSRRTERTVEAFRRAAEKSPVRVIPILAGKSRFPDAIDALNSSGCDGVLMIPDARVYNVATIKRLLLWGLRKKKPVWTFSAHVVKAGATAGLYADTDATVRQTAELIRKILEGADPKTIGLRYPDRVERSVNLHTIQAIDAGINLNVVRATRKKFGE